LNVMKPCSKNRKPLAWLALEELEAGRAAALREHLSQCEGCRGYWEEISSVANGLTAAKAVSKIEPSEFFYRRVAERLQAAGRRSIWENLAADLRGTMLNWRVALPVAAALVVVFVSIVALRQSPVVSPTPLFGVQSESASSSDLAPTIANYQRVAGQSLEKLDKLLTEQGNKALPPAPVYSASAFKLASASF
jgi:hypothetical protein